MTLHERLSTIVAVARVVGFEQRHWACSIHELSGAEAAEAEAAGWRSPDFTQDRTDEPEPSVVEVFHCSVDGLYFTLFRDREATAEELAAKAASRWLHLIYSEQHVVAPTLAPERI